MDAPLRPSQPFYLVTLILMGSLLLSACGDGAEFLLTPAVPSAQTLDPISEIIFIVRVPNQVSADQGVILEIVDDVTGLAFNTERRKLDVTHEANVFATRIQVPAGTVLKYRYLRSDPDSVSIESTTLGSSVHYRFCSASSSMIVQDLVAAWSDQPYKGQTGRLAGVITEAGSNTPLPDMLVVFGGMRTITASDGSFRIDSIIPGAQNIVVYSMDGSHQPFQQAAVIAPDALTPANIQLTTASKVNVSFLVQAPPETSGEMTVRMVGNLYSLGNTFSELQGGGSVLASRAPTLSKQADGHYKITLSLPVGTDLRYKYTLGDGFWNGELTNNGSFRLRQLIVPSKDVVIDDTVDTWKSPTGAPILFTTTAPANTPDGDQLSIQFNPFVWMQPIPMWTDGTGQWRYILYNPLNLPAGAGYRYCRNDQCGLADDMETAVTGSAGYRFRVLETAQVFSNQVERWAWWQPDSKPTTVISAEAAQREPGFLTGVELSPNWQPTWQSFMGIGINKIKATGAGVIVLTPTWTYTHRNQPGFEPQLGLDPIWADQMQNALAARRLGMDVILFPLIRGQPGENPWTNTLERSPGWWTNWFERYHGFALHHAKMATITGARGIVLGGPAVTAALPGGLLPDGSPSGVPDDAELRWREIIAAVRTQYSGPVYWALSFAGELDAIPPLLTDTDGIYLLVSTHVPTQLDVNGGMAVRIEKVLDESIKPLKDSLGKPIIIAAQYPSRTVDSSICSADEIECTLFDKWAGEEAAVDLQAQVDAYNALFVAANNRSWIGGIVSRGFYPPAALQDASSSIHGKPAGDVVWYWFSRLMPASNP